jgi:hypothetical protein
VRDNPVPTGARRLLIVSPHFPPVNTPDMQRIRMSLPHFREFGWEPSVLAVMPDGTETVDALLSETVPTDIPIERVRSIPAAVSRRVGIGNIAVRALPYLYASGCRLISSRKFDLIYFSTTMFLSMPLGRVWKRKYGTPYVLDIQDPWLSDYYETHPDTAPPAKYGLARRLHAWLEPWTMKEVDAVIAVSPAYIETLRRRYPWLTAEMCTALPFGVSTLDMKLLQGRPQSNPFFQPSPGRWHGVYTGVAGDIMAPALRILFRALREGLASAPRVFESVRLHFIGTDYAATERARKSVEPIAAALGVERFVEEQTTRIPYFQALQVVQDADCLILIGSDDTEYVASKLNPYVFARKPILAIVHEASQMGPLLRHAGATVITFSSDQRCDAKATAELACRWKELLAGGARPRPDVPASFDAHSAREVTRQQCAVFDRVLARAVRSASIVSCTN